MFVFLNIHVMLQLANILRYNLRYICTVYGITCIIREKFILTKWNQPIKELAFIIYIICS